MRSNSSLASNGGWFNSSSTRRRVSASSPSSISSATTSSSLSERKQSAMQDLPLDWTRVKRRRRAECNIDYNPRTISKSPLVVSDSERIRHGYAIFCLHDSNDPTWFQGYFVESALADSSIDDDDNICSAIPISRRPWGLLATKEEIDECMECENGGFRRISIKILHSQAASITLKGIDWTGGDMMRLSNDKVEMNTQRLLTGKDALPYLKQHFMTLIRKLQQACKDDDIESENGSDENKHEDILDLLPDVAVLVGKISLVLQENVTLQEVETKTVPVAKKKGADLWDD